jgi:hypothetical protein
MWVFEPVTDKVIGTSEQLKVVLISSSAIMEI